MMLSAKDLSELAVATWRLEKWISAVEVERKMAAKSSLRAIKGFLEKCSVEYHDITGSQFDYGLAVSVINNESDEQDEEKLIISEMVKPIILFQGTVIQHGQVILGKKADAPEETVSPDKTDTTPITGTISTANPDSASAVSDDARRSFEQFMQHFK